MVKYDFQVASGEFGDVTDNLISSVRKGLCDDYKDGGHLKSQPDFYEQIVDSVLDATANEKHDGNESSITDDEDDEFSDGFNTSR